MKLTYWFIRLWAPPQECSDPEEPHYVARVDTENGGSRWTVTRDYTEAHYFKKLKTAKRIVRCVKRIADRIARGWLYEIFYATEEIVETNVPEYETEEASHEV